MRKPMKIKKFCNVFVIMIIAAFSSSAWAGLGNENAGTTVFNFLKIESAARPTAMGGAFTGLADDASALYYNPAGTATLDGRQFILG